MIVVTHIACPTCGTVHSERLPPHRRRRRYYVCTACQSALRAGPRDCCVYCAFGHVPCLQVQAVADLQRGLDQHTRTIKRTVE